MREYIYYSKSALTTGNFDLTNLMKAGRMDIACNIIISAFFISHAVRKDIKLHLIFDGPPNAPAHLIFEYDNDMPISKKDAAGLIKRMLYKLPRKQGIKRGVFPGCSIEKKSFEALVKELNKEGKNIFILDERGEDIRSIKFKGDEVLIIGDQDGFPPEKKKFLKQIDKISVGPKIYFASQVITLINNELDRQIKSEEEERRLEENFG
jgi:tRNA (pseudouridine54-N1)-methyltransferase